MLSLRYAQPCDAEALTSLAIRSEAHWGYDSAFMDAFREIYQVTGAFIAENATFVAEEDGTIVGFYALAGTSLEYLYLEPSQIGKGLGRMLWDHLVAYCRQHRIKEIQMVCGPQPMPFYLKMGAVEIGKVESLVTPGRSVAKLAYRIE